MMKPIDRVKAMTEGKEVDRPGVAFWKHFPLDDRNVEKMIETTVNFQLQFESDFVKISHNGLYSIEDWGSEIKWPEKDTEVGKVTDFSIKEISDWENLKVNSPVEGALGREVKITKGIVDGFKGDVPVLATIFSPLTTAIKMSGDDTLFNHMKSNPDSVHKGLETITETTVQFVQELLDLGIDGVFFASQLATHDRMSPEEYDEFGKKYDDIIFQTVQDKTWFNIAHIHGEEPMFEKVSGYPVQALNWHDRLSNVVLSEAKNMTDKILIGGIEEKKDLDEKNETGIKEQFEDALTQVGQKNKLILGPGCVMNLTTTNERLALARSLVNKL